MVSLRMTPVSQRAAENPERAPAARVIGTRPVVGIDGVDADRRRSVREELNAAEERWPTDAADGPLADVRELAAAIGRLGRDATRVLRPVISTATLQRARTDRVDEQA